VAVEVGAKAAAAEAATAEVATAEVVEDRVVLSLEGIQYDQNPEVSYEVGFVAAKWALEAGASPTGMRSE
jgi:hypothetical protein